MKLKLQVERKKRIKKKRKNRKRCKNKEIVYLKARSEVLKDRKEKSSHAETRQ